MTGFAAGAGDRLDQHQNDTGAHPALTSTFVAASSVAAPSLVVPPGAIPTAAAAAWYGANSATFLRFQLPQAGTFRYVNMRVGTSSGNIQVGVVQITASSGNVYGTRRMSSGVIACPSTGSQRVDCGATLLAAGDYALFLWCDNTTATFPHSLVAESVAGRHLFSAAPAGGVPTSLLQISPTTRWVHALTLEADN